MAPEMHIGSLFATLTCLIRCSTIRHPIFSATSSQAMVTSLPVSSKALKWYCLYLIQIHALLGLFDPYLIGRTFRCGCGGGGRLESSLGARKSVPANGHSRDQCVAAPHQKDVRFEFAPELQHGYWFEFAFELWLWYWFDFAFGFRLEFELAFGQ